MTDEHKHAMKVWREALRAFHKGRFGRDDQAAAAVIAADRAGLVARVAELEAEIEEQDEWLQIVNIIPLDQFDKLGDYWIQRIAIIKMTNAIASVFSKFASENIMSRFREAMRNLMHQAFVEGCVVGIRNERARNALKDTRHDAET